MRGKGHRYFCQHLGPDLFAVFNDTFLLVLPPNKQLDLK